MKRERLKVWREDRGDGSIFFFVNAETGAKVSGNLYLSYRAGGKEIVVSAKTAELADAKRELKRLRRNRDNASDGKESLITPKTERVTVSDLLDANLSRAESKGLVSLPEMKYQTEILRALLGHVRAIQYRPEHTDSYIKRRLAGEGSKHKKKVGKTAIKHELEIIRTAFRYGVQRGVLHFSPYIEVPTVDIVREREIPLEAFPEILNAISDRDGRDFVEWFLLTGMRPRGIGGLRWEWFDSKDWTLKVPSEKGGNARQFAIEGTLRAVIERRISRRRLDCPFIFHSAGQPLDARRVRKMFYEALTACGFKTGRAGFTFYDTKKTAAGLLIDSGLSQREAMHFTGHKTASMFERYNIKSSERHRRSVRTRDAYLEKRLAEKSQPDAERVAIFPSVSAK